MQGFNYWISSVLFVFTAIVLIIGVYSFKRRKIPVAKAFAFLCFFSALYFFGYGIELFYNDISHIMFWNMFQQFGNRFIPSLWFLVAVLYVGKATKLNKLIFKIFIISSVILLLLRITNSFHHLIYIENYVYNNGYYSAMRSIKGQLFYVNYITASAAIIFSNFLYFQLFTVAKGGFKNQARLMLIASIMPWVAYSIIILNISPLDLDLVPVTLVISYTLIMLAIFRFRFFDLMPMAYYKVFENIRDAVIVVDYEDRILDFNPAAALLIELDKDSIGKTVKTQFHKNNEILQALASNTDCTIIISEGTNTNYYEIKFSLLTEHRGDIVGRIIMFSNITKQMEATEKFKTMATYDELTGIYNRRFFYEYANQELKLLERNGLSAAIIMFDIDYFKRVNDNFGHQAGDFVLKQIAEVTKTSIRSSDVLARFGGEEFIILLTDTNMSSAVGVAEKLCKAIEKMEINFNGSTIKITSSFGVSVTSSTNKDSLDTLIAKADQCLYKAKDDGRNRVEYHPTYKSELKNSLK